MYAAPRGTLKIAVVSVISRGVVIEVQFFWIVLLVVVVRGIPRICGSILGVGQLALEIISRCFEEVRLKVAILGC